MQTLAMEAKGLLRVVRDGVSKGASKLQISAAKTASTKVAEATQAAKTATNSTAAASAATSVAKSLPTTVKIAPAPKSTAKSTDGNGTKATITGLKPGQKIKVTVKIK